MFEIELKKNRLVSAVDLQRDVRSRMSPKAKMKALEIIYAAPTINPYAIVYNELKNEMDYEFDIDRKQKLEVVCEILKGYLK